VRRRKKRSSLSSSVDYTEITATRFVLRARR
jgi:hypothetical protein